MSHDLLHIDWGTVEGHPISHSEDGIVLGKGTVVKYDENLYQGFWIRNEDENMWYSMETFEAVRPLTKEEKEFIEKQEFLPF